MGQATNKLTQEVNGKALVAWTVDALRAAGVAPVVVVTGYQAEDVEAVLPGRECEFVRNPSWAEGMGSSLARGVHALMERRPRGLCVSVGDLPGLSVDVVSALLASFENSPSDDSIHVPTCEGRRGHPVLFGAGHLHALSLLDGDRGARDLMVRHASSVVEVAVGTPAIFLDVDSPDDLRERRTALAAQGQTSG